MIRTNHYSLKYLLDQRLSTVPQHQWVSKPFGFDFAVEYRPGRLNIAADALSRWDEESSPSADGTVVVTAHSGRGHPLPSSTTSAARQPRRPTPCFYWSASAQAS